MITADSSAEAASFADAAAAVFWPRLHINIMHAISFAAFHGTVATSRSAVNREQLTLESIVASLLEDRTRVASDGS